MLTLIRYSRGVPDVHHSPDREGIELRRLQPEQKEEKKKSSFAPLSTSSDLKKSRDIDVAILGLQEVMGYYWLDMEGLVLVSLLCVRAHQIASNGRYWRAAVRATFPMHPFEVGVGGYRGQSIVFSSFFGSRSHAAVDMNAPQNNPFMLF